MRVAYFPAVLAVAAWVACAGAAQASTGRSNAVLFDDGFELGDVEVPFGTSGQTARVQFGPVESRADMLFSIDTTGSMLGEITNLRNGFATVAASAQAIVSDMAYGVGDWKDFPISPFGEPGNWPWLLRQSITTNTASAQAGLNAMTAVGGGDVPESGYEALYQVGAGSGVTYPGGSVPPYTGAGLGGVGFRNGSARVILHVTDAPSHLDTDYTTIPDAHSRNEAVNALVALGARVIPVLSSTDPAADTQLRDVATSTGAEILPCGFPPVAGCATGQCCTGVNGAGEPPAPNGRCPLRFRANADGSGAAVAVPIGLRAVVKYGTHRIVASARDDGSAGTLDTTCFVDRIVAGAFTRPPREPEASCVAQATPAVIGSSGFNNGFVDFATGSDGGRAGSLAGFTVHLRNQCAPSTASAQVFVVNLDLTDAVTGALMDSVALSVVVPATP